ncbi:aldehyde dehydrogenase family protein [Methanotrichaceae archaeon M04Ac]|uniref:aldehyde dehydrogenase (NAD(+)) n=1 Tax=Candidatus Methanocrinis alkalitolerans TaxID=3033395 RepID=A0ABT5XDS7_9EURY|nr:aldehyde dehydrogenase family protein [Candidatus Methanocrinis alkalitolerans]MCR3883898.1 aldehyde dehydrogenase family protein [Methanothrix sp.]MDF0592868.1 aldehyde dehydrogenase family protein [Candidatus Methanocrinis alkalitolerans]
MKRLLARLGIEEENPGACTGPGSWIDDPDGRVLVSRNPTTDEPIGSVRAATPAVYEEVVAAAERGFRSWRKVPAPRRGEVVRDLGEAFKRRKDDLGDLISLEMGKIRAEGRGEVQEMIDVCAFAGGLSRQLYGLSMHSERPDHRMYEQWHPLGVVGAITSFNFPAAVWSWNAAVAAVAGDAVVWKPSSFVPLTAVAVQKIANEVMEAHGISRIFNLVIGRGSEVGDLLLRDGRVPLISFTGSTRTGRTVAELGAKRLARTILELGGNNAVIVAEDADLDLAVRAILFGAVGTAGQRCTTTRRVIVHRAVAGDLTDRLVRAYRQIRIGDPLDDGTVMGPLVDGGATEKMAEALKRARSQGGVVVFGGGRLHHLGPNFVEPAVVRMPSQTEVVMEETFAPILYILEYEGIDEAMAIQNGVSQGLASAIFTESLATSEAFLSSAGSDCGIANVNLATSGSEVGGAFGGEKDTGGGREAGSDAWKGYMRRQTVTVNWSKNLPLAQGIEFGEG